MDLAADALPLKLDDHGVIRVAGTRVTLETILHRFLMGDSAERIAESFDSVPLGAVYIVLGYYLTHRAECDEYLRRSDAEIEQIRRQVEAQPGYAQVRERLLARKAAPEAAKTEARPA